MTTTLRFLGTGASGGTPGEGRSRRWESSLLVDDGAAILIDVTRDFLEQAGGVRRIDAVLLTHAHRDAIGGMAQLRSWCRARGLDPLALHAGAATVVALRRRFARLDHVRLDVVDAAATRRIGRWTVRPVPVPHAREPGCPTFAWRLADGDLVVVYASDVACLTAELEAACADASVLVVDGAMWHRSLFTHLRIDRDLPVLCRWPVDRIVLTQIGRSAPPHEQLVRAAAALCPRAAPAFDGMVLPVG